MWDIKTISDITVIVVNAVLVTGVIVAYIEYRSNIKHKALSNAIFLVEKFLSAS